VQKEENEIDGHPFKMTVNLVTIVDRKILGTIFYTWNTRMKGFLPSVIYGFPCTKDIHHKFILVHHLLK
jgi:hypothetical protein